MSAGSSAGAGTHVDVIGAGVAGLCVATTLLERGASVTLWEQAAGLGPSACSWWAGGMLAPWCERESAQEPVSRLGASSVDWWSAHGADVSRNGSLVLALGRDRNELRRFARRTAHFDTLDGDAIATLEPDLAGRFREALFFSTEAHLAPRDATAALLARLRQNGAELRFGADAGRPGPLPAQDQSADGQSAVRARVDCRGLAAREQLPALRGVKGEMLIVHCPDVRLSRPVRLLHPRIPLYIVPRTDDHFMIGATMIESAERRRISARSMLELLGAAYALHPAFGEAEIVEIGVDARPAFPDNLPRVTRRDGTWYANGLFRHGFLLAPALARMTADAVLGGDSKPEWLHTEGEIACVSS